MKKRPPTSTKQSAFLARIEQGGRVYWCIRSTQRPGQRVLQWLGRNPLPADIRKALMQHGLDPESASREPRRLPAQTKRRRYSGIGSIGGRRVRPRGAGPHTGFGGTVRSRFAKR